MATPITCNHYARYDDVMSILEANRRGKPKSGCNVTCVFLIMIGTTAAVFLNKQPRITESTSEAGDSEGSMYVAKTNSENGMTGSNKTKGGSKKSKGKGNVIFACCIQTMIEAECDDASNIPAFVYCFDIFANGSNIPCPCPANYTFKAECTDTCQSNIQRDGKDGNDVVVDLCPINKNNTANCCFENGKIYY
eukprot:g73193.t1